MERSLVAWSAERGYRVAWGPRAVIEDARQEIAARKSDEIDNRFFDRELKSLFAGAEWAGHTVVVVAVPRPAHRVHFDFEGKSFDAVLPPTYVRYRALFEEIRLDLVKNGLPGRRVELLVAPLKAIASRLGLVTYGRNNIGYVHGLGSYFQLCGYLTDAGLPDIKKEWDGEASLLPECEGCSICTSLCPTGAIEGDRVLLRAERCLTYANENPGDWPDWVSRQAHNTLLGCLECQRACPANPDLPVEETGLTFSSDETRQLLAGGQGELCTGAATGIRTKLAWLGQPYAEPVLGRNLSALKRSIGSES